MLVTKELYTPLARGAVYAAMSLSVFTGCTRKDASPTKVEIVPKIECSHGKPTLRVAFSSNPPENPLIIRVEDPASRFRDEVAVLPEGRVTITALRRDRNEKPQIQPLQEGQELTVTALRRSVINQGSGVLVKDQALALKKIEVDCP